MGAKVELIRKIKHPAVVAARANLVRGDEGAATFLVDGCRLLERALEAGAEVDSAFFLEPVLEEELPILRRARQAGVACFRVQRGVFFKTLNLGYETSVRVLASVRRSPSPTLEHLSSACSCLLVGETIQDPRNVGVMIRTADGWDSTGALFSQDSADPYCRACIRSSTGSIFSVPLTLTADLPGCLRELKGRAVRVVGSSARAEVPCWEVDLTGRCALVLGNESTGLSADVTRACDVLVTMPMSGSADSFNVTVAAGMLLYERARQVGQASQ